MIERRGIREVFGKALLYSLPSLLTVTLLAKHQMEYSRVCFPEAIFAQIAWIFVLRSYKEVGVLEK
jgi:hypothetical protein